VRKFAHADCLADAVEIRLRAERRVGEMMEQGKDDRAGVGRRWDNGVSETPLKPTLDEAGINKNLAKRARILRDKSDEEFVSDTRAEVKLGVERLERRGTNRPLPSWLMATNGRGQAYSLFINTAGDRS
jgi:hypothetical protein